MSVFFVKNEKRISIFFTSIFMSISPTPPNVFTSPLDAIQFVHQLLTVILCKGLKMIRLDEARMVARTESACTVLEAQLQVCQEHQHLARHVNGAGVRALITGARSTFGRDRPSSVVDLHWTIQQVLSGAIAEVSAEEGEKEDCEEVLLLLSSDPAHIPTHPKSSCSSTARQRLIEVLSHPTSPLRPSATTAGPMGCGSKTCRCIGSLIGTVQRTVAKLQPIALHTIQCLKQMDTTRALALQKEREMRELAQWYSCTLKAAAAWDAEVGRRAIVMAAMRCHLSDVQRSMDHWYHTEAEHRYTFTQQFSRYFPQGSEGGYFSSVSEPPPHFYVKEQTQPEFAKKPVKK